MIIWHTWHVHISILIAACAIRPIWLPGGQEKECCRAGVRQDPSKDPPQAGGPWQPARLHRLFPAGTEEERKAARLTVHRYCLLTDNIPTGIDDDIGPIFKTIDILHVKSTNTNCVYVYICRLLLKSEYLLLQITNFVAGFKLFKF